MSEITGDSDEYCFLSEAVELSKSVEGLCLELGLRLGMGSKTILDAVRQHCPEKWVISVDCYGNMPYTGREPDGETHYDYTDDMMATCMANMWEYVKTNGHKWKFFPLSDMDYFDKFADFVPIYGYDGTEYVNKYSMVHLDGPHTVGYILNELVWFNKRMDSGSTVVIDDVTPDFVDFEPIKRWLTETNWEHIKTGNKKSLWRKV